MSYRSWLKLWPHRDPSVWLLENDVAKDDSIIADVHTNPNQGPLPGPDVLHVATGDVFRPVRPIDPCDGPVAFAGPEQRYA